MKKIKNTNIKIEPIFDTTIFLMGDKAKQELDNLVFDNKEKHEVIIGFIIQFLTTLTNNVRQDKPLSKTLYTLTTLIKVIDYYKKETKKDNKKIDLLTMNRCNDLHNFAKDNKLTEKQEKEIINEVLSLNHNDLIKARNYGFSVIDNEQEMKKDNLHDIYFYQYATIRWIRELKEQTNNDIKKVVLVNKTLTNQERNATNHFIKKNLPLFIESLSTADIKALLNSIYEAKDGKE